MTSCSARAMAVTPSQAINSSRSSGPAHRQLPIKNGENNIAKETMTNRTLSQRFLQVNGIAAALAAMVYLFLGQEEQYTAYHLANASGVGQQLTLTKIDLIK